MALVVSDTGSIPVISTTSIHIRWDITNSYFYVVRIYNNRVYKCFNNRLFYLRIFEVIF